MNPKNIKSKLIKKPKNNIKYTMRTLRYLRRAFNNEVRYNNIINKNFKEMENYSFECYNYNCYIVDEYNKLLNAKY
jgi:hypothetical protein